MHHSNCLKSFHIVGTFTSVSSSCSSFHHIHCFVDLLLPFTMSSAVKVSVVRMSSSTLENLPRSHEAKLTLSILRTHSDNGKSSSSSSVVAKLHSISADTSSLIIPARRKQFRIVFFCYALPGLINKWNCV